MGMVSSLQQSFSARVWLAVVVLLQCLSMVSARADGYDADAGRSVEQCAEYLCSSFTSAAKNFIAQGCEGNFADTLTEDIMLSANELESVDGVATSTMLFITGTCGLVALGFGYMIGRKEAPQGYEPVPTY